MLDVGVAGDDRQVAVETPVLLVLRERRERAPAVQRGHRPAHEGPHFAGAHREPVFH